ncbi:hypothetical protein DL95DRAFT_468501 [Leptodontidium sp. 2 PMI_412]|nr:hypothetical protein DL95DRAFT_468501 [Leptodontidium sp. 2 PMI_412]
MATSSSTDPHQLVKWLFLASKEFPNLDPITAFHRFIRERKLLGLFFIEVSSAINLSDYFETKTPSRYTLLDQSYWLRKIKSVPEQYDAIELSEVWKDLAHPSESGWNLPQTHERHLLKFPQEIIHLILCHVLIVPTTTIDLVEDNDYENSLIPCQTYILRTEKVMCGYVRSRIMVDRMDSEGKYTEIREAIRPAINASVLRSCKAMYGHGNTTLYASLKPDFKIWKPTRHSGPRWKDFAGRPLDGIPSTDNEVGKERIAAAISAIEQRLPIETTPDFVYENSSDLNDNIAQKLSLYLPFILKFCPSVETLGLQIAPESPRERSSKLKDFIGSEIGKMKKLKELVVREGRHPTDAIWAKPIIAWLEKREDEAEGQDDGT